MCSALLTVVSLAAGQGFLDMATHGKSATGSVGESATGDPGAVFIRCGTGPAVLLAGYESSFRWHPNRDGMVIGIKTAQTKRAAEDVRNLGRFS